MKTLVPVILLTAATARAQVYIPPADSGRSQPSPNPASDTVVTPRQEPAASPFGQEIPALDPAAETITIGGVTIPLGDNRALKARFEKFLSQAPEDDEAAAAYHRNITGIIATVSPFNQPAPDLAAAFKILPRAAAYPGDANICGNLAEAVYMAMLSKRDISGLKRLNDGIEKEKQEIIREGDWKARHERDKTLGDSKGPPGKGNKSANQPATTPGTGAASLHYVNTLRRIAEIEALKKANIVRTEAQTVNTKTQYQANMALWFIQRRFEHVIMAARFYNQIWKDGDTTLRVDKDSDVAKLFSQSVGVNPTVSSLDSLSNEAIREANKYIEAFNLMLSRGEMHNASQRLMEAFAIGEFLEPLATLPLEKKLQVLAYTRDLNEVYGALQARDFTRAKELADSLRKQAKDFPASKMDSVIAGNTVASDLAIEEAKSHLLNKENDKATEKFAAAVKIWPTNPKIAEFRKLVGDASPMLRSRDDFDRLLAEGNFREILKRQYEFGPIVGGDPKREAAFKQIIGNLMNIEAAIGKAGEFSKAGQKCAAWEQLTILRDQFPDDPKLGREIELLAPDVAKFTESLSRAKQFESRTPRQTGTALAWYLKARDLYPNSKFAGDGIKRLLDDMLPDDGSSGSQAVSGKNPADIP